MNQKQFEEGVKRIQSIREKYNVTPMDMFVLLRAIMNSGLGKNKNTVKVMRCAADIIELEIERAEKINSAMNN